MRWRSQKTGRNAATWPFTAIIFAIAAGDNGVGLSEGDLSRVFQHGFTTKSKGHGFGLHSGALAAMELGGQLTAASPGPGQGASFTLELPRAPGCGYDPLGEG